MLIRAKKPKKPPMILQVSSLGTKAFNKWKESAIKNEASANAKLAINIFDGTRRISLIFTVEKTMKMLRGIPKTSQNVNQIAMNKAEEGSGSL